MYTKKGNPRKSIKKQLIITIFILGIIFFDLLTPFGGTIKFYSTWLSCGNKPVVTEGSGYFNTTPPFYYYPPTVNILPGDQIYYCTPHKAEMSGYGAGIPPKAFDVIPILIVLLLISVWYLWWRLKKRHNIVKTGNQSSRY